MKKRVLSLVLTAAMAATVLAGCGSSSSSSTTTTETKEETAEAPAEEAEEATEEAAADAPTETVVPTEDVTITFWQNSGRKEVTDECVEAFMEAYPNITIEVSYFSTDDLKTNCKVAASSDSLPDMWYNWGGTLGSYYPENGLTYDLTEYAEQHNWSDKYMQACLDLAVLDGQMSGLASDIAMYVYWYRPDVMEKCGVTEMPTTFAEFEDMLAQIKAAGVYPFAGGSLYGWQIMRYVQDIIEYYAGAEEHDKLQAMEADWGTSEAVLKAFQKYQEWVEKGYFQDGFMTEDPNNCRNFVWNGTCAMAPDSVSFLNKAAEAGYDPTEFAYLVYPSESNPDGTGRLAAYINQIQINKNVTDVQLEAIMTYFDWYYDSETNPHYEDINQPCVVKDAPLPENLQAGKGCLEVMEKQGTYTQTDQALPTEVADQLFAAQDGIVTGEVTPEQAGQMIQDAIDAYKASK